MHKGACKCVVIYIIMCMVYTKNYEKAIVKVLHYKVVMKAPAAGTVQGMKCGASGWGVGVGHAPPRAGTVHLQGMGACVP